MTGIVNATGWFCFLKQHTAPVYNLTAGAYSHKGACGSRPPHLHVWPPQISDCFEWKKGTDIYLCVYYYYTYYCYINIISWLLLMPQGPTNAHHGYDMNRTLTSKLKRQVWENSLGRWRVSYWFHIPVFPPLLMKSQPDPSHLNIKMYFCCEMYNLVCSFRERSASSSFTTPLSTRMHGGRNWFRK